MVLFTVLQSVSFFPFFFFFFFFVYPVLFSAVQNRVPTICLFLMYFINNHNNNINNNETKLCVLFCCVLVCAHKNKTKLISNYPNHTETVFLLTHPIGVYVCVCVCALC